MEWAEGAAYGILGLKPYEFYELTPAELIKMLEGYERRRRDILWIVSYYAANLMGTQIKNISPEKLMKPFLPIKSKEEKEEEKEAFFRDFYSKRKEETGWRQLQNS